MGAVGPRGPDDGPRRPVGPTVGRYRAPDEKTIRMVLDRLELRTMTGSVSGLRGQFP
jgi:hypothetical protein